MRLCYKAVGFRTQGGPRACADPLVDGVGVQETPALLPAHWWVKPGPGANAGHWQAELGPGI